MTSSDDLAALPRPHAVATAAAQLRDRPVPRAAEIADRVLAAALRAERGSPPVRARAPHQLTHVSSQVLTTLLRAHIDNHLRGAAVGRIAIHADRHQALQDVTVELYVQYGTEIAEVAQHARHLAREALDSALGSPQPAEDADPVAVEVTAHHIHVSDVTVGDPHLVDPDDERPGVG
ncbi:MAG: hypothetical protein ABI776_14305 [Nocardioidaceae bacterium]